MTPKHEPRADYPEWTRLGHVQCPNCPLKEATSPQCPVAARLTDVIEFFKDSVSNDKVTIEIKTSARTYLKEADLSTGISALMGLYMATSGCPILDKLKPMVTTHLPFATLKETLYRLLSNYMLAQYFRARNGKKPDLEMKGFMAMVQEIGAVNKAFCKRLYSICKEDAPLNAVVHLNAFTDSAGFLTAKTSLSNLEKTFHALIDADEER